MYTFSQSEPTSVIQSDPLEAMLSVKVTVYAAVYAALSFVRAAVPEPNPYILSFPTEDNPLQIAVNTTHPEYNYILLIGDWGAQVSSPTDIAVQTEVANKMKAYYKSQKEQGYNLLFVGTVGDNFYWGGQDCNEWAAQWSDMYGDLATNHPWLAVLGNHDWGSSDPNAVCAWGLDDIPYIDASTNIPYAGNQLNADKKGCNPSNYYLPDYGYYYTINELNFEWIALEQSVTICPSDFGDQTFKDCNGSSTIGCAYLGEMANASEAMMLHRANVSTNTNFLISQHYWETAQALLDEFSKHRPKVQDDTIWTAYGHAHKQECDGTDANGQCELILTGGGSGCCSEETLRGFYVIGFHSNKTMAQPLKIDDPQISCQYPCGANFTAQDVIDSNLYHCCKTTHGKDCELFDLSKCAAV